jgi:hypothetical protein
MEIGGANLLGIEIILHSRISAYLLLLSLQIAQ